LRCWRVHAGAVHSVVFGGFAAPGSRSGLRMPARSDHCGSCGIEPARVVPYKPLLDAALELAAHRVPRCPRFAAAAVTRRLVNGRDRDWAADLNVAEPVECVPVARPIRSIFSIRQVRQVCQGSGARQRGARCRADVEPHQRIGMKPGEVFWAASISVGWWGTATSCNAPLFLSARLSLRGKTHWNTGRRRVFGALRAITGRQCCLRRPPPFARSNGRSAGEHIVRHGTGKCARCFLLESERIRLPLAGWAEEYVRVRDRQLVADRARMAGARDLPGSRRACDAARQCGRPVPGYSFCVLDADHSSQASGRSVTLLSGYPCRQAVFQLFGRMMGVSRPPIFDAHPGYYTQ